MKQEVKKSLIKSAILIAILIILTIFIINKFDKPEIDNECVIENPDPDGYLLKICKYLKEHEDTIFIHPANPTKYQIINIGEGVYSGTGFSKDVLVISLDCCYMGDLAYVDKYTKEVIGFSPGDQ